MSTALLLGAGRMGTHHARVLAQDPHVHELLVSDVHPERAEALASRWGATAVPRGEARPDLCAPRWVIVATPTSSHGEARAWADAGCHVLVEKPLAASHAEAAGLLHDRIRVGHVERHNPALVAANLVGLRELRGIRIVDRAVDPRRDVATDLLLHDLDLLLLHDANLRCVFVSGDPHRGILARFVGHQLEATLEAGVGPEPQRTWHGRDQRGSFSLDLASGRAKRDGHRIEGGSTDALEAQWRTFREGRGVTAAEGLRALSLAEQVLHRLRQGS